MGIGTGTMAQSVLQSDEPMMIQQVFSCEVHHEPSADELRLLWQSLEGGAVSTPFQTLEFIQAFRTHMLPTVRGSFRVLQIFRKDTHQPILLLPLVVRTRGFVKIASIPDLTLADLTAPVLSRHASFEEDELEDLWQSITHALSDVDILDIFHNPAHVGALENPFFRFEAAQDQAHFFMLDLTQSGDVDPGLKSKRKKIGKDMRSKWRKLDEMGATFDCIEDPAERLHLLEIILQQKQHRFDQTGVDNCLSSDPVEDFYRELVSTSRPEEPVVMHAIRLHGEVLGATMCLVANGIANCVLLSMGNEKWSQYSPGMVALSHTADWARGAGYRAFSLGTGTQPYKRRFGFETHQVRRINASLSVKGKSHLLLAKLKNL